MSFCTINGIAVLEARLALPRMGLWQMDATLEDATPLAGAVEVAYGSTTLRGAVVRSGERNDSEAARIVGGAGGLARKVPPKSYLSLPLRIPLQDILAAAGETLSASAEPALLAAVLSRWTIIEAPASSALLNLIDGRGVAWRAVADGSIWLGAETWPAVEVEHELISEDKRANRITIAAEDPKVMPGTVFLDRRVSYVEHNFTDGELRTEVWFE